MNTTTIRTWLSRRRVPYTEIGFLVFISALGWAHSISSSPDADISIQDNGLFVVANDTPSNATLVAIGNATFYTGNLTAGTWGDWYNVTVSSGIHSLTFTVKWENGALVDREAMELRGPGLVVVYYGFGRPVIDNFYLGWGWT